jgi:uncharacterized protein YdeI (YjbR/CyaY-like superfamily)
VKPKFFSTSADFRAWLRENHSKESELLVGYYKVTSKKVSMTWPESVDQALCFGWIDGIRRTIDEESYSIRFTPRRPGSNWSTVNIEKVRQLKKDGLMREAGLAAFEKRKPHRSEIYGYERKALKLSREYEAALKQNGKAWAYFSSLSPYVKKASENWVMSAKREDTRERRLSKLIESCEKGEKPF